MKLPESEEPRPISIDPEDFIELMRSDVWSIHVRGDLEGVEFSKTDEHGKTKSYIAVGNFDAIVARISKEMADILGSPKYLEWDVK